MRERILRGFREMACEIGFYRSTMDELSVRTGISKRTLYRYFRSKDDMVNAVMEQIMASISEETDKSIKGENPAENVISFINVLTQSLGVVNPIMICDLQKYYPTVWQRVESFRTEKMNQVAQSMISGEKQGYFRETIPEIFITALQSSIRDVVNPAFILKHGLTIDQTIKALFDIFFYGIFTEQERKSVKKAT